MGSWQCTYLLRLAVALVCDKLAVLEIEDLVPRKRLVVVYVLAYAPRASTPAWAAEPRFVVAVRGVCRSLRAAGAPLLLSDEFVLLCHAHTPGTRSQIGDTSERK